MEQPVRKILRIDASARQKNSYSRAITNMLINKLNEAWPEAVVVERDIYKDSHFLSEAMVEGMASSANTQKDDFLLPVSDLLIQELLSTDILVLAVPMYNFTIPAALKAYIDLV